MHIDAKTAISHKNLLSNITRNYLMSHNSSTILITDILVMWHERILLKLECRGYELLTPLIVLVVSVVLVNW